MPDRHALRAVPESPPRALGLIRVSKERDGMISPDVQRVAIGDYSELRGYEIVGWLEGIDQSGSRAKSAWWPRLEQAVAAVEAREYDVIVVWKFSRIARHRLRWAIALDRVESAGGRIESATEQFDTSNSAGRMARGMLGELNTFTAEMIGESWKEAHGRRVQSGRPHTGKPKWGYLYDRDQKLHVPDPETGPVLADLYRRYVAGESMYTLVRWLNAHGYRTLEGNTWRDSVLRRVLDAGFGAGRFVSHGELRPGIHQPVIDEPTWQAYLDARAARRGRPARTVRSQYVLSGLVRCARCGGAMVAGQHGHARAPKMRCADGKERGPESCQGGYVMIEFLERRVLEWLAERAGRVDAARFDVAAADSHRVTLRHEGDRLARELVRNEESLARLAVQNAVAPLPDAIYERARGELETAHVQLVAALEVAQREERGVVADPAAAAAALLEGWDERPVEIRREGLRKLIRKIDVLTGRPQAKVKIYGDWEPVDITLEEMMALPDDRYTRRGT
jgi:site-specific DNA recombinase